MIHESRRINKQNPLEENKPCVFVILESLTKLESNILFMYFQEKGIRLLSFNQTKLIAEDNKNLLSHKAKKDETCSSFIVHLKD